MNTSDPLPQKVRDALQRGQVIEAIKLMREMKGLGLKDAKDLVDAYLREPAATSATSSASVQAAAKSHPGAWPPEVLQALQRGNKIEAIRLVRQYTGLGLKDAKDAVEAYERSRSPALDALSPGEVPRRSGAFGWLLVLVGVAAAMAWYFLRSPG